MALTKKLIGTYIQTTVHSDTKVRHPPLGNKCLVPETDVFFIMGKQDLRESKAVFSRKRNPLFQDRKIFSLSLGEVIVPLGQHILFLGEEMAKHMLFSPGDFLGPERFGERGGVAGD